MLNTVTTWLEIACAALAVLSAGVVAAALVGGVLGVGAGLGAAALACAGARMVLVAIDRRMRTKGGVRQ